MVVEEESREVVAVKEFVADNAVTVIDAAGDMVVVAEEDGTKSSIRNN